MGFCDMKDVVLPQSSTTRRLPSDEGQLKGPKSPKRIEGRIDVLMYTE